MIDKRFIDESILRVIESSDILMEFFGRKKKDEKPKKVYKYSDVVSYINGIRSITKDVIKKYDFEYISISTNPNTFGGYTDGQDFESFDDFLIVQFDSEDDNEIKRFAKELGDRVRGKYPVDIDVEGDRSEVYIFASLD